jgi:hypothetical protein
MIEKIDILRHQYEGYDVHVQRLPNVEIWHIIKTENDIALRFKNTDTYSQRITLFGKALDEINSHKEQRTDLIQKDLFICLMQEVIKHRQPIKLRWADFTVAVKPTGCNLSWVICLKDDVVRYISQPGDDELDSVYSAFLQLLGVKNG